MIFCAHACARLYLVVNHLVRDIAGVDLRTLLLQVIGDLRLHFRHQVGVLLKDLDDLIGGEVVLQERPDCSTLR